jgi:hypothetical protein
MNSASFAVPLITSDTAIKAPLEPAKLFEGIRQGRLRGRRPTCHPTPRPRSAGRPQPRSLMNAEGCVRSGCGCRNSSDRQHRSRNRQSPDPGVVHDHVGLGQHQIAAVACIVIGNGAGHVEDTGTTQRGETVGGSSCGGKFSSGGVSTKVIGNDCSYANGKVLVEGVGENLLPSAQSWRLWWPGLPVPAPYTRACHIDLSCNLGPAQTLVTQVQDLLSRDRVSPRAAATHGDSGVVELLADRGPMNAQLGTDLAQGQALGIQVRRTLNVHGATVAVTGLDVASRDLVANLRKTTDSVVAVRNLLEVGVRDISVDDGHVTAHFMMITTSEGSEDLGRRE